MTFARIVSVSLVLLALAACNGPKPQGAVPPSGIEATGSAGTTGGAARAPAGSGVVSTTRP